MELFGIVGAVPAAFLATALYTPIARWAFRNRWIERSACWVSTAVLVGLILEWGALASIGPVRSRGIIGPLFYALHSVFILLAVPAFANLLIIKRRETVGGSTYLVALLCSLLALPVVLTQYGVAEALYGINGNSGPYGKAPTVPLK